MKQKILEKLQSTNTINSLQKLVANAFYRKNPNLYFLGLYLASAYSSGCLYVTIKESYLPSVEDLWGKDFIFEQEEINYIQDEIRKGASLAYTLTDLVVTPDGRIFFERAYKHLVKVKDELARICEKNGGEGVEKNLQVELLQLVGEKKVTEEQSQALYGLLTNTISILYGGPGTGKTHTAGIFLRLYLSKVPHDKKERMLIALSGPTGKATQNLKASIQRAFDLGFATIENCIQAKTLHALLGISSLSSAR